MRHILTRFSHGRGVYRTGRVQPPGAGPSSKPNSAGRAKSLVWVAMLGLLSAGLYGALLLNGATLNAYAEASRHGDRVYFLIPIGIAFVFSLVHGAFTGQFWDVIGLKPKPRGTHGT